MYTEIVKITEGGLAGDKKKVQNYALVLADNLEKQGEEALTKKIRNVKNQAETAMEFYYFVYVVNQHAVFPPDVRHRVGLQSPISLWFHYFHIYMNSHHPSRSSLTYATFNQ